MFFICGGVMKKAFYWTICSIFLALLIWFFKNTDELPTCDNIETKGLVAEILNDNDYGFIDIRNIEETGFNKQSQVRLCKATLSTSIYGAFDAQYKITLNEDKSMFYVEFIDQFANVFDQVYSQIDDNIKQTMRESFNDAVTEFNYLKEQDSSKYSLCMASVRVISAAKYAEHEDYSKWLKTRNELCDGILNPEN